MNRKTFLATLGAALVAPFAAKLPAAQNDSTDKLIGAMKLSDQSFAESCKSLEELTKAVEEHKRKVGYVSVCYPKDTHPGDWTILVDGKPTEHKIQRAHDIEGWYEYTERVEVGEIGDWYIVTHHVKAPVSITYHGDNPRYAAFKAV